MACTQVEVMSQFFTAFYNDNGSYEDRLPVVAARYGLSMTKFGFDLITSLPWSYLDYWAYEARIPHVHHRRAAQNFAARVRVFAPWKNVIFHVICEMVQSNIHYVTCLALFGYKSCFITRRVTPQRGHTRCSPRPRHGFCPNSLVLSRRRTKAETACSLSLYLSSLFSLSLRKPLGLPRRAPRTTAETTCRRAAPSASCASSRSFASSRSSASSRASSSSSARSRQLCRAKRLRSPAASGGRAPGAIGQSVLLASF